MGERKTKAVVALANGHGEAGVMSDWSRPLNFNKPFRSGNTAGVISVWTRASNAKNPRKGGGAAGMRFKCAKLQRELRQKWPVHGGSSEFSCAVPQN